MEDTPDCAYGGVSCGIFLTCERIVLQEKSRLLSLSLSPSLSLFQILHIANIITSLQRRSFLARRQWKAILYSECFVNDGIYGELSKSAETVTLRLS